VGVSWNKIFAKFGSDYKKPDAVTDVNRDNYRQIVWPKPAEDLLYVGRATKRKLAGVGIHTIGQIAEADPSYLHCMLGKQGLMLSVFARGEDKTPVAKENTDAPIKSIGNGMTMPRDLVNDMEVKMAIYMLSESVATRLRENHFAGDVIEIFVRDNDLMGFTRQHKIPFPTNISDEIARQAMQIFLENYRWQKPIRGVGVRVASLHGERYPYQLDLFQSEERREKQLAVDRAVDEIRKRFGTESIQRGLMFFGPEITPRKRQEQTIHPHSYLERGNQAFG
jgi:DNA polymerase-4